MGLLAFAVLLVALPAVAAADPAPSLSAAFGADTVALHGTAQLTFTLSGPPAGGADATAVGVGSGLPHGLDVGSGVSSACGGSVATRASKWPSADDSTPATISLYGATVPVGGSCQFTVPVIAREAGDYQVVASGYGTKPGSAALEVPPIAQPVTATSAFSPETVVT